jgi:hypothetical protein
VRPDVVLLEPLAHCFGYELKARCRLPKTERTAVPPDELLERLDDVGRREAASAANCQALASELVDDRQGLQRTSINRLVVNEVASLKT